VSTNISYAIFSDLEMMAEKYGKYKRSHWQIENSLHWCLDIAFNEDQSWMRKGFSAENMNISCHMCLNMPKQEKTCRLGIKGKRKKCGWDYEYFRDVLWKMTLAQPGDWREDCPPPAECGKDYNCLLQKEAARLQGALRQKKGGRSGKGGE